MSVGPTRGPVQRPGHDRDLTELFQRVEDLERVTPTPTGIQFEKSPQAGGWFEVTTTTVGPSSQGIYLRADVGSIATPGILLSTDGILKLDSNHVVLGEDDEIDITTTVVSIGNNEANYPRRIDMQLANLTTTPQGSKFVVYDANGDSIFEVRDDGTLHIKTGTSPIADL